MLSSSLKARIISMIENDEVLTEDFKNVLFPVENQEYELSYLNKMRKEDVLANFDGSFPLPLQIEKTYSNLYNDSNVGDWSNFVVFGDNLQFLKAIYENNDPYIKDKVKGKVNLIYIDPPFATSDEFQSKDGAKAYSDRIKGSSFIEYLRRRIIYAREILSNDGSIIVHLDSKKSHYIKVILDEIFGENNFVNEIVWQSSSSAKTLKKNISKDVQTLLWYSKTSEYKFNKVYMDLSNNTKKMYSHDDNDGRGKYRLYPLQKTDSPGPLTTYDYIDNTGKVWKCPKKGWRMQQSKLKLLENDGRLDLTRRSLSEKAYWNERDNEGKVINNLWNDISNLQGKNPEITGYPTQKPEQLLKRIIEMLTDPDDIVLDFFAGSGTTMSVAEKLNRKWIMCDLGKLSYYTMIKRLVQIPLSSSLTKKGKYGLEAKSFATYTLGVYDLEKVLELEWKKYTEFFSKLFDFDLFTTQINGFKFEGKKDNHLVKIFDYKKLSNSSIDENYLVQLNEIVKNRVNNRVYIVAPANYFDFISDYYEIDGIRFYFLKIPYQIIKELHKIPFQKAMQPRSKSKINSMDESIGFYFIRTPKVTTTIEKDATQVFITINKFESSELEINRYKNRDQVDFGELSMILIDNKYNGKEFQFTDVYFASDMIFESVPIIKVKIPKDSKQIMIVYSDIYGNDFSEIFEL